MNMWLYNAATAYDSHTIILGFYAAGLIAGSTLSSASNLTCTLKSDMFFVSKFFAKCSSVAFSLLSGVLCSLSH